MKKIELDGEIYYYINGKYVDSHFIEVDTYTKNKLVQQEKVITINQLDKGKNSDNVGDYSKLRQKYTKNEKTEEKTKINHVAGGGNSNSAEPMMSDYNVTSKEILEYETKMKEYQRDYQFYQTKIKEYEDKKNNNFVYAGLILFPGSIPTFMLVGFIQGEGNVNFWTFAISILINFVLAFIYYRIKMPSLPNEIHRNSYISDQLYNKVEKYNQAVSRYKEYKNRLSKSYWDNLDGYAFEKAVADLFSSLGAATTITPKSGDHGIDVIARYKGRTYAIQCKHHGNPVGPGPVRELRGVVEGEYDKGIFVSLNGYTQQARQENYSAVKKVILLDREKLIRISEQQSLDNFIN